MGDKKKPRNLSWDDVIERELLELLDILHPYARSKSELLSKMISFAHRVAVTPAMLEHWDMFLQRVNFAFFMRMPSSPDGGQARKPGPIRAAEVCSDRPRPKVVNHRAANPEGDAAYILLPFATNKWRTLCARIA